MKVVLIVSDGIFPVVNLKFGPVLTFYFALFDVLDDVVSSFLFFGCAKFIYFFERGRPLPLLLFGWGFLFFLLRFESGLVPFLSFAQRFLLFFRGSIEFFIALFIFWGWTI